jgi:hypothetical protein
MKESLMMVTKYFNNVNKTNNNLSRPLIEHNALPIYKSTDSIYNLQYTGFRSQ